MVNNEMSRITDLSRCLYGDKVCVDLLSSQHQLVGRHTLVLLTRDPELNVLLTELRLQELPEQVQTNCNVHTHECKLIEECIFKSK